MDRDSLEDCPTKGGLPLAAVLREREGVRVLISLKVRDVVIAVIDDRFSGESDLFVLLESELSSLDST